MWMASQNIDGSAIRELVTIVAKRSIWATERMIEQAIDALRICIRPPNRAVFPANCGSAKHRQNPKTRRSSSKEPNIA